MKLCIMARQAEERRGRRGGHCWGRLSDRSARRPRQRLRRRPSRRCRPGNPRRDDLGWMPLGLLGTVSSSFSSASSASSASSSSSSEAGSNSGGGRWGDSVEPAGEDWRRDAVVQAGQPLSLDGSTAAVLGAGLRGMGYTFASVVVDVWLVSARAWVSATASSKAALTPSAARASLVLAAWSRSLLISIARFLRSAFVQLHRFELSPAARRAVASFGSTGAASSACLPASSATQAIVGASSAGERAATSVDQLRARGNAHLP